MLLMKLLLAAGCWALATSEVTNLNKPNILFVLADDMGWGDIGYHAATYHGKNAPEKVNTPMLDELAGEGLKLEQHYAQSVCSPSRASLLTGRHVPNHGVGENVVTPDSKGGIPASINWFSEVMKEAGLGYDAHFLGKTHLGSAIEEYLPTANGFDTHSGIVHGEADFWTYYRNFFRDGKYYTGSTLIESAARVGQSPEVHTRPLGVDKYDGDYLIAELEKRLAARQPGRPLFVYMALRTPHEGFRVEPKAYNVEGETAWSGDGEVNQRKLGQSTNLNTCEAALPSKGQECARPHGDEWEGICSTQKGIGCRRPSFVGMMKDLDDTVRAAVDAFKAAHLWENTIFVFSSDNGATKFGRDTGSNLPLLHGKKTFGEGGIRVPAFVRGTDLAGSPYSKALHQGKQTTALMHISDWYLTLLHWMGHQNVEDAKRANHVDGFDQHRTLFEPCDSSTEAECDDYKVRDSILFAYDGPVDSAEPKNTGKAASAEAIDGGWGQSSKGNPGGVFRYKDHKYVNVNMKHKNGEAVPTIRGEDKFTNGCYLVKADGEELRHALECGDAKKQMLGNLQASRASGSLRFDAGLKVNYASVEERPTLLVTKSEHGKEDETFWAIGWCKDGDEFCGKQKSGPPKPMGIVAAATETDVMMASPVGSVGLAVGLSVGGLFVLLGVAVGAMWLNKKMGTTHAAQPHGLQL